MHSFTLGLAAGENFTHTKVTEISRVAAEIDTHFANTGGSGGS